MSTLKPPYESLEQVEKLAKNHDTQALKALAKQYMAYFHENECFPLDGIKGWSGLGAYFIKLAMAGSDGLVQTRAEFEKATKGLLRHPVPEWIKTVKYVQTDLKGEYYLSLPPKALAQQAFIHAHNPVTTAADYVVPPIYTGIDATLKPEVILNTRITDYVISHCA